MKRLLFPFVLFFIMISISISQPIAKDMAEIRADGIQVPVVNHMAVNNPTKGLLVFDIATNIYWYFDGGQWSEIGAPFAIRDADGDTRVVVEDFPDSDEISMDVKGRTAFEIRETPSAAEIIQFRVPGGNHGNLFFGQSSGEQIDTTGGVGGFNTVFGIGSGNGLTTGEANTFMGQGAGNSNDTGTANTFIGDQAGGSNVGSQNTFIGKDAGASSSTGSNNVYLGAGAGFNNLGSDNVFIGIDAGFDSNVMNYTVNQELRIDNTGTSRPLVYGDFANDVLGINWDSSVPPPSTLSVDGTAHIEDNLTVNGTALIRETLLLEPQPPITLPMTCSVNGTLMADTNGLLYFCNGTDWKTVQLN